jgi:lipopolysaccharide transport system ATP-binding protein
MSSKDLAVSVRGLSKSYVITHNSERPTNFRELLIDRLRHPLGNAGQSRETFWALKDVEFEIRRGESVGIIGRNGAGKSTLLKLLSRITSPTTGSIDLYGHLASLLEVGTGFHAELTGRENIFLNGSILGMRRRDIERRFDEIVEFSGVERFLDTPVKRYSSGMYVRLAFAVAAHLESEILIVDEVLSVGDSAFQKKCMGKMNDVLHQGRTVLFVSHSMSSISALCGRVLVMEQGQLTFDGPTSAGISHYSRGGAITWSVDLSSVANRQGPVEYGRLLSVSLFDGAGRPCDHFSMGDAMIVEMELECSQRICPAEVGLALQNAFDLTIHLFVSTWEGLELDLEPGRHRFRVTVPQVLVYPGTYSFTPWVKRQGCVTDDQIDEAIHLVVEGADVTGHNPYFERYTYSKVEVYCPSEWRHTSELQEQQQELSRATHD